MTEIFGPVHPYAMQAMGLILVGVVLFSMILLQTIIHQAFRERRFHRYSLYALLGGFVVDGAYLTLVYPLDVSWYLLLACALKVVCLLAILCEWTKRVMTAITASEVEDEH